MDGADNVVMSNLRNAHVTVTNLCCNVITILTRDGVTSYSTQYDAHLECHSLGHNPTTDRQCYKI